MAETTKPLVNRVAASTLINLDLEKFYPAEPIVEFDIAPYLFQGLILREKDFREALNRIAWEQYQDKAVVIFCSADAIIPMWAYMLVSAYASPFAFDCFSGTKEDYIRQRISHNLAQIELSRYQDGLVLIKGCGEKAIPASAYVDIVKKLRPVAKSIMYGEACSTVPVYKKPKG